MKCPHRCKDCGRHFVLRRRCDNYLVDQKCPSCGSKRIRFDEYEYARRRARKPCTCLGAHYPHRKGSVVLCDHAPPPTDEQLEEYYYGTPQTT